MKGLSEDKLEDKPVGRTRSQLPLYFVVFHLLIFVYLGLVAFDVVPKPHSMALLASFPSSPCMPSPPRLVVPVDSHAKSFVRATRKLDVLFNQKVDGNEIQSLAVAVVTPGGSVFEGFYGVKRANETDGETVDRHSVYRVASISKLFTMMETFILRDRNALMLDDPVQKFVPNFRSHPVEGNTPSEPTTLRQLASHMSGIASDLPPGNAVNWPYDLSGMGAPFPTPGDLLGGIREIPLVVPPYSHPVYSNSAFAVLGLANVAANSKAAKGKELVPKTHAELLQRDIFVPLGLNGSSFEVTEANKHHIVVSSVSSGEADTDFLAMNPSGGQYGSLADLVKVMQTLLDPTRDESLLSPYTMREWLRPIHSWGDDLSEVGVLWEIVKRKDTFGRSQRVFQKLGALYGQHSVFTLNPASGYGVVVLMTGASWDSHNIAWTAMDVFQSAFDEVLASSVAEQFAGHWVAVDGTSEAHITTRHGSLWLEKYVLNGSDVLTLLQGSTDPVGLWHVPTTNSFRISFGVPGLNQEPNYGCMLHWLALDVGYSHQVSVNLIQFVDEVAGRVLRVPSVGVDMLRKRADQTQASGGFNAVRGLLFGGGARRLW